MATSDNITAYHKRLRRVSFVAAWNGGSIAVSASLLGIVCLFLGDWLGAVLSIAALSSGALELYGRRQLHSSLNKARRWLSLSQIWLFGVIVVYAAYQLISFDLAAELASLPPELQQAMKQLPSLDPDVFRTSLQQLYQLIYLSIIGVSFLYQGGLCWFYQKSVSKLAAFSSPEA